MPSVSVHGELWEECCKETVVYAATVLKQEFTVRGGLSQCACQVHPHVE